MTSSRPKRSLSPLATIPPENCTRDTFDQHDNLSDTQFLCWALQTETRVRFAKLEERHDARAQDTSLNSEYLIDLYPVTGETKADKGKLARERHAFARNSIPYLQSIRDPDMSFEGLTRLEIDRPQSTQLKNDESREKKTKTQAIPPNLLFFEIILEAYVGYKVPTFHSKDPTQPRAAIMGGAVVAALASWRDENVADVFLNVETNLEEALKSDDTKEYENRKEKIRAHLHSYFLHGHGPTDSPFSLGDVDIFLQASPLTRSLMIRLLELSPDVAECISSHLGGCELVHQDLQRFATFLCKDYLADLQVFERIGYFYYALSKNGLSFALGTKYYGDFDPDRRHESWPRTTQLIMLNEKADLVGGLMDFDISVASCGYDGVTVYATPRAAFSFKTLIQVVTPFVYEEKRNRSRITKYYQRGFGAFVLDPCCSREDQHHCYKNDGITVEQSDTGLPIPEDETDSDTYHFQRYITFSNWTARALTPPERYEDIIRQQQLNAHQQKIFVCKLGHCSSWLGHYSSWIDGDSSKYSIALIEKREGHALEYFAKRDSWPEDFRQKVLSVPEAFHFCCRDCREEYALQLVLDEAPEDISSMKSVEETLHGEMAYKREGMLKEESYGDLFAPSFYGAGAFNSSCVGENARSFYQLTELLKSQQIIERARYLRKYGSLEGYEHRFVHGGDLTTVFSDAEEYRLPANGRAPVGLNPERFIAQCKGCQEWLHGCEFNVQYCEHCSESKPAAIEND